MCMYLGTMDAQVPTQAVGQFNVQCSINVGRNTEKEGNKRLRTWRA